MKGIAIKRAESHLSMPLRETPSLPFCSGGTYSCTLIFLDKINTSISKKRPSYPLNNPTTRPNLKKPKQSIRQLQPRRSIGLSLMSSTLCVYTALFPRQRMQLSAHILSARFAPHRYFRPCLCLPRPTSSPDPSAVCRIVKALFTLGQLVSTRHQQHQ